MTKQELCDNALSRISDRDHLPGSEQARICDRHYRAAIDEVLQSVRWGFATRATTLCTPVCHPLGHAYTLPDDCIRLLEVSARHYKLHHDRQIVVARSINELTIEYVSNEGFGRDYECIPDSDPLFARAVTVLLAHKICMPITGDKNLELALLQEYQSNALPQAATINKYQDASNDQHPLEAIMGAGLFRKRRRW